MDTTLVWELLTPVYGLLIEMIFILLPTKQTDFHEKGFALDLPLKARVSEIWKWLTSSSVTYTMTCQKIQPTVDIRYTNFKNGTKSKTYYLMIGGPELHLIKLATNSDQVLSGLLQKI